MKNDLKKYVCCTFCFAKDTLGCISSVALRYLQWDCCLMVSGSDRLIVGKNVWIRCTLWEINTVYWIGGKKKSN